MKKKRSNAKPGLKNFGSVVYEGPIIPPDNVTWWEIVQKKRPDLINFEEYNLEQIKLSTISGLRNRGVPEQKAFLENKISMILGFLEYVDNDLLYQYSIKEFSIWNIISDSINFESYASNLRFNTVPADPTESLKRIAQLKDIAEIFAEAGKMSGISYPLLKDENLVTNIHYKYKLLDFLREKLGELPASLDSNKQRTEQKPKPAKIDYQSFNDIFVVTDWKKYAVALQKTTPPLINGSWEFIGKPKKHKGVICAWFKHLQYKGTIKQIVSRSQLAAVLNNEIKNFSLGKDGKTFDNISNEFDKNFKDQLLDIAK